MSEGQSSHMAWPKGLAKKNHIAGNCCRYNPALHPKMAEGMKRIGETNQDVADAMGIHLNTLQRWANDHPELKCALSEGKDASVGKVARLLYKAAVGELDPVVTEMEETQESARGTRQITRTTTTTIPPNVSAQKMLLGSLSPRFREQKDVHVSGAVGLVVLPPTRPAPEIMDADYTPLLEEGRGETVICDNAEDFAQNNPSATNRRGRSRKTRPTQSSKHSLHGEAVVE